MRAFVAGLAAALAALALTACGNDTAPPPDTTAPVETAAPVPTVTLIEGGKTAYTVVRAEGGSQAIIRAAMDLRNLIGERFGVAPGIAEDWMLAYKGGQTVPADVTTCEILVGETNRAETAAVRESIDFALGYRVQMVGDSLVILGTNEAMTLRAIADFTAQQLAGGDVLALPEDYALTFNYATDTATGRGIMGKYRVLGSTVKCEASSAATDLVRDALFVGVNHPDVTPVIVVGENENFPDSVALARELGYMDYAIRVTPEQILVVGGSPFSTRRGAERFMALFAADAIGDPAQKFTETWRFADARPDSLIYHTADFKPSWANSFTPPAWMGDFAEKAYAITCPDGRYVTDSHRGDSSRYPENSAEGIYSAVLLGADMIEIDIRLTADHVPVLMHDATLTRTTDVDEKKGKDGLPSSVNVVDWTYDQLLALNLTLGGEATSYKIPTAYEAVALMAGRCFVHWDCKDERIDRDTEVYRLAEDLGAKSSFYFYYGANVMTTWRNMDKSDADFDSFIRTMQSYLAMPGHRLARRNFDTINRNGDHADGWAKTVEVDGYRCVFTNEIEAIAKLIAKQQSAQVAPGK